MGKTLVSGLNLFWILIKGLRPAFNQLKQFFKLFFFDFPKKKTIAIRDTNMSDINT